MKAAHPFNAASRLNHSRRAGLCLLLTVSGVFNLTAATLFNGPLLARNLITLNGTIRIDSFDSSNPLYSTNGQYIVSMAKDGGNVGTLASNIIDIITLGGSVDVYGHVYTGPGSTIRLFASAQVGSLAWVNGGNIGIEPNHGHSDLFTSLPAPPAPPTNRLAIPPKTINLFQGTAYSNSYLLTAGNYEAGNTLAMSSTDTMLISGAVKLYCVKDLKLSGASQVIIGTNSSLRIYAGADLDVGGNGIQNRTGFVTNLTIYGINPTNASIQYTGATGLIGSICAPTADVYLAGGATCGSLVGSVVADTISTARKFDIHYDEATPSPLLQVSASSILRFAGFSPSGAPKFRVVRLEGFQGLQFVVETSTNLANWSPLLTNTAPFTFTADNAVGSQQFFRASSPP